MYRKNLHKYLESRQNPEDIYYIYGQHKKRLAQKITAQAAADYIFDSAAATLEREIKKALSDK